MSDPKNPGLDYGLIRGLAELLKETDLTEIEIEQSGLRLRVSRAATAAAPALAYAAAPAPAGAAAQAAPAEMPRSEADYLKHPGLVTSPMVGTAYAAPQPGAPAFVKPGDQVREGQTLLIVEAMKTMNPITAHRSGKVTKLFFADAQPVEFGQPLVLID